MQQCFTSVFFNLEEAYDSILELFEHFINGS